MIRQCPADFAKENAACTPYLGQAESYMTEGIDRRTTF